MSAQTYASIKQAVAIALTRTMDVGATFDAIFESQFPMGLSYAEDRIYQEIPFLGARQSNATLSTTAALRTIDLSALPTALLVPEQVSLITPAGQAPAAGTRVPYDMVSLDMINRVWPVEALTEPPSLTWQGGRYFALSDALTLVLAPTPDAVYFAEIVGLYQPAGLSEANPSTYLSNVYPELLETGCLVFLAGAINRNFGAQSDEPRMAVSWEAQFEMLLKSARFEEARRRGLVADAPMAGAA